MINVVYFASIRERLGIDREQVELVDGADVSQLLAALVERGAPWDAVLQGPALLVAVNQEMSGLDRVLHGNDEVAFFPPVTGG